MKGLLTLIKKIEKDFIWEEAVRKIIAEWTVSMLIDVNGQDDNLMWKHKTNHRLSFKTSYYESSYNAINT
jgi:hypothetical protein